MNIKEAWKIVTDNSKMEKRFYLINLQCKPKSQKLLTPVE